MPAKKFILCKTKVSRGSVRRETRSGIEHIVVSSTTLPDNVVMNGLLYPADEIAKSYASLERTLAPVEHPIDSDGNFLSASDPEAIHAFHAGAWNTNVTQENGRIKHDVVINVPVALQSERGKRLLDRINEIETSSDARPIHTSVGLWCSIEDADGIQCNDAGQEYTGIARDMQFDHNAILLDSTGAATPEQGVGLAINSNREKIDVEHVEIPVHVEDRTSDVSLQINATGLSADEIYRALDDAFERSALEEPDYIEAVYQDEVIYKTELGYFSVPYRIDEERATIIGMPIPVDKKVTYEPKMTGNHAMKNMIINALTEAGVATDGLDDTALMEKFIELKTNHETTDKHSDAAIADAIKTALEPITNELKELRDAASAESNAERESLINTITNSGIFPGLDADAAGAIPTDKLRAMAANCGKSYGVPLTNNGSGSDDFAVPTDMPE